MKNKSIHIAAVAAAVLVPVALFLHTFSASPLPKPERYTGPLPWATPPQDLAVFSVVTGVNHRDRVVHGVFARLADLSVTSQQIQ